MTTTTKEANIGSATMISPVERLRFNIHDFCELNNVVYRSTDIQSHGYRWYLEILPFGEDETNGAGDSLVRSMDDRSVAVFLHCQESTRNNPVKARVTVRMGYQQGRESMWGAFGFTHRFEDEAHGWGHFASRAEAYAECNEDGMLTIQVSIQVFQPVPKVWKPHSKLADRMLRMYESGDRSDVTLIVGDSRFHAHLCVLAMQCPMLADLCDKGQEVHINDAQPNLLDTLLRYIYSEQLPLSFDTAVDGLSLLRLADRFGCVQLKLLLEAEVLESRKWMSFDDAIELLLFADSHSCALLRETAMSTIANHTEKLIHSSKWKTLKQSPSLMAELLVVKSGVAEDENNSWNNASVAMLRKLLSDNGVEDVDGTKDMLVGRWKEVMLSNPTGEV